MWSRLQRFFAICANNWQFKLLAVLLAVGAYHAIMGVIGYEVLYDLPVKVEMDGKRNPDVAILDQDVKTVQVTFRGSQEDLRRLDQRVLEVVIRPQASQRKEWIAFSNRHVEGARGVKPIHFKPASVLLTFGHQIEKEVAVLAPVPVGTPLAGHVEIDYHPRTARLRGPGERLKDRHAVATESVDVDGRVASFSRTVKILPPSDIWVSRIEPSEVTVQVKIVTESIDRKWEKVPVQVLTDAAAQPGAVRLDPKAATVTVTGRAQVVEKIAQDSVSVYVDVRGLAAGSYELPLRVILPVGLDVRQTADPTTVKVEIEPQARSGP
jgi:YbbR domain-containing protein